MVFLGGLEKEKEQITNIRNERRKITTDHTDIIRRISKYYEKIHANNYN